MSDDARRQELIKKFSGQPPVVGAAQSLTAVRNVQNFLPWGQADALAATIVLAIFSGSILLLSSIYTYINMNQRTLTQTKLSE